MVFRRCIMCSIFFLSIFYFCFLIYWVWDWSKRSPNVWFNWVADVFHKYKVIAPLPHYLCDFLYFIRFPTLFLLVLWTKIKLKFLLWSWTNPHQNWKGLFPHPTDSSYRFRVFVGSHPIKSSFVKSNRVSWNQVAFLCSNKQLM